MIMKNLLILLLIFLPPICLNAEEYNGTTGDCTWHLDTETGVMTISGNGNMGNHGYEAQPWYDYRYLIKKVVIEDGVTSIGRLAFSEINLSSIEIPTTVNTIGSYAFLNSYYLTAIRIPSSVTSIGEEVFGHCSSLNSITVDSDNPYFNDGDGCNCIINSSTSKLMYGCKSTVIPSNVTGIDEFAFYSVSPTYIEIPSSVNEIGNSAFLYCDHLSSVKSFIKDPFPFGENAFVGIGTDTPCILYVPAGTRDAYIAAGWTEEIFKGGIMEMEEEANVTLTAEANDVYISEISPLSISLENDKDVVMTEFYMHLPDGILINEDNGGYFDVTLNPDRVSDHVVEVVQNTPGVYHFLCYSPTNAPFLGSSGELMKINLGQSMADNPGSFSGSLTSVLVATSNLNGKWLSDVPFEITFLDYDMGDVNGDSRINGLDVVEVVNNIMGRPSTHFIWLAADFDKNKVINAIDLVEEVDLLMMQVEQQAVKARDGKTDMISGPSIPMRLVDNNGNLSLSVESTDNYILAQYILQLSEGQTLNGIIPDANHIVAYKEIGENRYAVVCYSMRNDPFVSNDNMMNLSVDGEGSVSVTDALFINTDMQECRISPAVSDEVTDIIDIASDFKQPTNIYSIGGQLIRMNTTSTENLPQGIYIINGKKYIKK